MNETTQAPAAAATQEVPAPSGHGADPGRPANGSGTMTRAELAAEFSRNARARRRAGPATQPNGSGQPPANRSSAPVAPETPLGAEGQPDAGTSNAASAPAGESSIEQLANGTQSQDTPPAPAEGGEAPAETQETSANPDPGPEDLAELVEDEEAIANLTDDQVKAIKDSAIRKLVKRVRVLTARYKAQEARLNQGRETGPEATPPSDPAGNGYDHHPEIRSLDTRIQELDGYINWAEANPDGGTYTDQTGKNFTFGPDQVRQIVRQGNREIQRLESQRSVRLETLQREEAQVRQRHMADASQAFAWMAKPESEEYGIASELLRNAPYLRNHPEWPLWLGDAIEGRKARLARATAPAKPPSPRPTPPRVPPPTGGAAPRVDPLGRQLAEAEAAYEKSGRESDLKRVMTLQRQVRQRAVAA